MDEDTLDAAALENVIFEEDGTRLTLEEYLASVEEDGFRTLHATGWDEGDTEDEPDTADCD